MSCGRRDATGAILQTFLLTSSHAFLHWYLLGHECTEFKGTPLVGVVGCSDQTMMVCKQRHTNAIGHFWGGVRQPQGAGIGKDEGLRNRGERRHKGEEGEGGGGHSPVPHALLQSPMPSSSPLCPPPVPYAFLQSPCPPPIPYVLLQSPTLLQFPIPSSSPYAPPLVPYAFLQSPMLLLRSPMPSSSPLCPSSSPLCLPPVPYAPPPVSYAFLQSPMPLLQSSMPSSSPPCPPPVPYAFLQSPTLLSPMPRGGIGNWRRSVGDWRGV